MHSSDAIERLARRGQRRGADAVLSDARDRSTNYVDLDPIVPSPVHRRVPLTIASGLLVLAAVGVVLWPRTDPAPPASVAAPAEEVNKVDDGPSLQEVAAAQRLFREQAESGWVPFQSISGIEGVESPKGWVRYNPESRASAGDRQALYDEPNGKVLGYYFPGLGYVPAELADAPEFDLDAAYEKQGRCLPSDQQCQADMFEERTRAEQSDR